MSDFVITQEMLDAMPDLDCGHCNRKVKTLLPNGMCPLCFREAGLTQEDLCRMMRESWGPQTWEGDKHVGPQIH